MRSTLTRWKSATLTAITLAALFLTAAPAHAEFWISPSGRLHDRMPWWGYTVLRPELYHRFESQLAYERWVAGVALERQAYAYQKQLRAAYYQNHYRDQKLRDCCSKYGACYDGVTGARYECPSKERLYESSQTVMPSRVIRDDPPVSDEQKAWAILKLARVFHADGQKTDAADFCEKIIAKYPATAAADDARELLLEIRGAALTGSQ